MKKLLIGIPFVCVLLWGATSGSLNWTQLASGSRHGSGAKGQSSDGTHTTGTFPKYDSTGTLIDSGVAATSAGVSSFSGDGTFISNSASVGAVTATLGTAAAHKWWGNNTGSTAAPGYQSLGAADLPAVPLTAGTSVTLSGTNQYFVCTSTCTITVPVPAAGVQYCLYNDDNVSTVITLSAIGSSSRYETTARTSYGTAGTGTMVSGGAVGDKVCIVGRDSTHYSTLSYSGTWTVN